MEKGEALEGESGGSDEGLIGAEDRSSCLGVGFEEFAKVSVGLRGGLESFAIGRISENEGGGFFGI